MQRVKLFVIQVCKGGEWENVVLYKGNFREALKHANEVYSDFGSRIKRVTTPAAFSSLSRKLGVMGDGAANTEWDN